MSLANKVAKAQMMGDPGIFGDIWGGIKKVAQVGTGIASNLGIPGISGIAGFANRTFFPPAPGTQTYPQGPGPVLMPNTPAALPGGVSRYGGPMVYNTQMSLQGPGQAVVPKPGFTGMMQRMIPGGSTGLMVQGGPPQGASMSGYHLNKSDYFLRDGSFIPAGTKWVKNRRRNALNPRALSRSMSRITSAKKAATALGRISIRKKSCA